MGVRILFSWSASPGGIFTRLYIEQWTALMIKIIPDDFFTRLPIEQCSVRSLNKKIPPCFHMEGFFCLKAWQWPTLTQGDPALPSAIHLFTSEFDMGSGGSNALWSPDKLVGLTEYNYDSASSHSSWWVCDGSAYAGTITYSTRRTNRVVVR